MEAGGDRRKRCEGNSNLQAMLVIVREGVSREADLSLSYSLIPYGISQPFSSLCLSLPPPPPNTALPSALSSN